jgi:hypothetical protein
VPESLSKYESQRHYTFRLAKAKADWLNRQMLVDQYLKAAMISSGSGTIFKLIFKFNLN